MKILVPVDGSKASQNAVAEAIRFAKKYDGSIKLLTIIGNNTVSESSAYYAQFSERLMEDGEILLESIMKMDFGGVPVEKEVKSGLVYEQILDTADKENIEMIVMGNRGFSKIRRFFIGSVAQRVISEAKCPVLVVHAEAEE